MNYEAVWPSEMSHELQSRVTLRNVAWTTKLCDLKECHMTYQAVWPKEMPHDLQSSAALRNAAWITKQCMLEECRMNHKAVPAWGLQDVQSDQFDCDRLNSKPITERHKKLSSPNMVCLWNHKSLKHTYAHTHTHTQIHKHARTSCAQFGR